jgi:hypothetical protein
VLNGGIGLKYVAFWQKFHTRKSINPISKDGVLYPHPQVILSLAKRPHTARLTAGTVLALSKLQDFCYTIRKQEGTFKN